MRPRIPVRAALLAAAGILAVGCSKPRTVHYTYAQAKVSDSQLLYHMETMRKVEGVVQVTAVRDNSGLAKMTVVLKESERGPGMTTLNNLGYERSGD